jgi:hypothetical protein
VELGLTNAGFSRGLQSGAARVAILPTGINCVFVASGFLSTNAYGGTNKRIDPVAATWSLYADYWRCSFVYSLQVQRLKSAKRDRAQYTKLVPGDGLTARFQVKASLRQGAVLFQQQRQGRLARDQGDARAAQA